MSAHALFEAASSSEQQWRGHFRFLPVPPVARHVLHLRRRQLLQNRRLNHCGRDGVNENISLRDLFGESFSEAYDSGLGCRVRNHIWIPFFAGD